MTTPVRYRKPETRKTLSATTFETLSSDPQSRSQSHEEARSIAIVDDVKVMTTKKFLSLRAMDRMSICSLLEVVQLGCCLLQHVFVA